MDSPPVTLADLTPRQLSVASMLARGYTTKQIAATLTVGERWVRNVVTSIAYRIGSDPTRDDRVLVALWYQQHVPIRVGTPIRAIPELQRAS